MINKLFPRFVLALSILFALAACQPSSPPPAPLPLTGEHASKLGASALILQSRAGGATMQLVPVLASTGKPAPGYAGIDLGVNIAYAFSPNREQVAILSYGAHNCPAYCFHRIDVRGWKESLPPVEVGSSLNVWAPELIYDVPANRAAFVLNEQDRQASQVVVVDLKTGKTTQVTLEMIIFRLRFTPEGSLAIYGSSGRAGQDLRLRVAILDGASLAALWQHDLLEVNYSSEPLEAPSDPTLSRYLDPGVAFAPDGSRLYIVAADAQKLVTVNFERRSVSSVTIQPPQSFLDRLMASLAGVVHAKMLNGTIKTAVISNDGNRLFVVGQTSTTVKQDNGDYTTDVTSLGLQVIDTASGAELSKLETDATYLSIAPDGQTVFLYSWPDTGSTVAQPRTEVFDSSTLKITRTLVGEVHASRLLNGELAWLSTEPLSATSSRLSIFTPGDEVHPRSQWTAENGWSADWFYVP